MASTSEYAIGFIRSLVFSVCFCNNNFIHLFTLHAIEKQFIAKVIVTHMLQFECFAAFLEFADSAAIEWNAIAHTQFKRIK